MIAGNELLLKNANIDRSYARVKNPGDVKKGPTRRSLIIVQIPSRPNYLRQSEVFRVFQRLIFNTRVHFDSSFDANLWAADERGVHARSPELRRELKILSDMHNKFVEACKQLESGNTYRGWVIIRSTFELNDRIVRIQHHRLFPDLLGVLLLLQQRGSPAAPGLDHLLRKDLCNWARVYLPGNDPRRQFFELIMLAPLESIHHLYLTFDSQCRELWNSNIQDNEIGSYYSYNQASFPRADRGNFYSLFERKTVFEICDLLGRGDERFGFYSTEAFCLWHTALQYFCSAELYDYMAYVSAKLCGRLKNFTDRWDHSLPTQLNHDAAMTFYLHGHVEDARGNSMNALYAFRQCIMLRSQVVDGEKLDFLRGIALRRLETIATRVGDGIGVGLYQRLLDAMYYELEAKDQLGMASLQHGL